MKPRDPTARASRPEFDVHLTETVMLPMRDGVRMATDIYRPARAGRPLDDRYSADARILFPLLT